ncbi:hypothetical protein H8E52_08900 [bacterium]|nr:hypothetical protein [bacterium]
MRSPARVVALLCGIALVEAYPLVSQPITGPPKVAEAPIPGALQELLILHFDFAPANIQTVRRGDYAVKILDGADSSELIAMGVLRIDATPTTILEALRQATLPPFAGMDFQAALFSRTPALSDLKDLTLAPDVIAGIASCKAGDCIFKLPAADMARFRNQISWKAPDAGAQANTIFRELLLQYLVAYQKGGGQALPRIDDKKEQLNLEAVFQGLLARSLLRDLDLGLSTYLDDFPTSNQTGIESTFFWSRKKLGPRYVASLHHRGLRVENGPEGWSFVATRRIYANHFFQAGLDLAVVIPREDGGSYLLRVDHARVDALTGVAKLGRGKLKQTVREGLAAELEAIRAALMTGR